jgi:predicted DNA-binding transcriptional regulator YafY
MLVSVKRSERLHALTESLRRQGNRGRTAAQLAAEFEVTTRTIKRDLAALQSAGLPVWSRTGPGGGYGLAASSTLPPVNFSPAQALALCAAVSASPQAPFADSARAATRKVLDVLDPATRRRAMSLAERVWVNPSPPAPRHVLSALENALADQVTVTISYVDRNGTSTRREIEPMIFALNQDTWWLVGWCLLRDAVRWFAVDQVRRATVTSRPCSGHPVSEIGAAPVTARPVVI